MAKRPGLWANIDAKRKRIEEGSGEKMRKPGDPGAPTAKAIKQSQVKKRRKKRMKDMA
jgi:hypothetical protein